MMESPHLLTLNASQETDQIARERFVELLRVLHEVQNDPKRRFRMTAWMEKLFLRPRTCCAIGWATLDPWFNAQGFSLHLNKFQWTTHGIPQYAEQRGWDAVKAFFSTESDNEGRLFAADAYPPTNVTLGQVIERIERYVHLRFDLFHTEKVIATILSIS